MSGNIQQRNSLVGYTCSRAGVQQASTPVCMLLSSELFVLCQLHLNAHIPVLITGKAAEGVQHAAGQAA